MIKHQAFLYLPSLVLVSSANTMHAIKLFPEPDLTSCILNEVTLQLNISIIHHNLYYKYIMIATFKRCTGTSKLCFLIRISLLIKCQLKGVF